MECFQAMQYSDSMIDPDEDEEWESEASETSGDECHA